MLGNALSLSLQLMNGRTASVALIFMSNSLHTARKDKTSSNTC